MLNKKINICFIPHEVSCDGRCTESKGDRSTFECDEGYADNLHEFFPTKWCVRQCDRCVRKKVEEDKHFFVEDDVMAQKVKP